MFDDRGICFLSIVCVLDDKALIRTWGEQRIGGLCYLELDLHTETLGISIGVIFSFEHKFDLLCLADCLPSCLRAMASLSSSSFGNDEISLLTALQFFKFFSVSLESLASSFSASRLASHSACIRSLSSLSASLLSPLLDWPYPHGVPVISSRRHLASYSFLDWWFLVAMSAS